MTYGTAWYANWFLKALGSRECIDIGRVAGFLAGRCPGQCHTVIGEVADSKLDCAVGSGWGWVQVRQNKAVIRRDRILTRKRVAIKFDVRNGWWFA